MTRRLPVVLRGEVSTQTGTADFPQRSAGTNASRLSLFNFLSRVSTHSMQSAIMIRHFCACVRLSVPACSMSYCVYASVDGVTFNTPEGTSFQHSSGNPLSGALNTTGWEYLRVSTEIVVYLGKGTRLVLIS